MLLELAVGDAYGAGFEYAPELVAQHNDLSHYVQHPRHATYPGQYTDDTQMSLAVTEAILSAQPWSPQLLADYFVAAFKRDPREGYAGGFHAFLTQIQSGTQFLAEIEPYSDKSGAAMRACPIGIFPDVVTVLKKGTLQAKLTHNTADGITAANAVALMTHYFLYHVGPKAEVAQFLDTYVPGYNWSVPWSGKVKSKGWMSVRAAVTAVIRNNRLSQMLQDCINFTGDVDTVAAIALGAASCSKEVTHDLPPHLVYALEDGPYGRSYIEVLDRQLLSLIEHYRDTQ
ncbi:MAG: ADP-ribosylglycohydrolase family protein [Kouleothrix sp.]|nr:ADP-ribosylglycohydrolase family protein [Kouleothrix sp.]